MQRKCIQVCVELADASSAPIVTGHADNINNHSLIY